MSIVSQDIDETPSALFKKLYDEIKIGEKYEEFKSHPIKGRKEKIDLIRIFLD